MRRLGRRALLHFIIAKHPAFENVWIVGGGPGHGYKHGPVVGEQSRSACSGRTATGSWRRSFA